MKKFEYDTISIKSTGFLGGLIDNDVFKQLLNDKGRNGWELTEIVATHQGYGATRLIICVFKREIL